MTTTMTALPRRIENPVQNDAVTFLETSEESGGERSLGELEVGPGGRVNPHAHLTYSEHFHVTEGRMTIEVGGVRHELGPGDDLLAPAGAVHAWSNPTSERAVALIEVRPGHPGFETTLRVGYGLARDGRTFKDGMPRNPLHLALLLHWSDIRLAGLAGRILGPLGRLLTGIAVRRGVDVELQRRYARAPSRP